LRSKMPDPVMESIRDPTYQHLCRRLAWYVSEPFGQPRCAEVFRRGGQQEADADKTPSR
jgi:hypothetical protein